MKLNEKTIENGMMLTLFSAFMLSHCMVFAYFSDYIMITIICCSLIFKKNACFKLSHLVWLGFLIISSYFSFDQRFSKSFIILFYMLFILFFLTIKIDYWDKLIKLLQIITAVIAISIIIELFINDFVVKYLWFTITPVYSQIQLVRAYKDAEFYIGAYSGIAGEKADAAFYMCIGIGIQIVYYCSVRKIYKSNVILLSIYILALLLTGKKTLLICAILFSLIIVVLSEIHKKYLKLMIGACCLIFAFIIAQNFMPELGTVFERFQSNDSMEERYNMWNGAIRMFMEKPIFGFGYASLNLILSPKGEYFSFGHNIYIELLGETGIVGILLFTLSNIVLVKDIWIIFKKRNKNDFMYCKILYFVIYTLGLWYVYGLTGNVMFYKFQIFLYFLLHYMVGTLLKEVQSNRFILSGKRGDIVYNAKVLHSEA